MKLAKRFPPPKLRNKDDDETVLTNNGYMGNQAYPYHVQYTDGLKPLYKLMKLGKHFLPKFELPYDSSIPSIDLMNE